VNLERYSIIGLMFSVTIILLNLYLLKKRKINAKSFTLWFILGLTIGIVSMVPAFFSLLYVFFGTEFLISAVTVTAFMVLVLMIFYLDYKVNDLNDKLMKLTAELSALKYNPNSKILEKEDYEKK